jgi:sugar O-acyltransferase (sialic acid O-acetyltransferase NeuD family)
VSGPPILLVGAGGHARACIDVIEREGRFVVGGLIGLAGEVGHSIFGYPVLGTDAELAALRREYDNALVAIGQIKTPELRERSFLRLEESGYKIPAVVSPRAYVSSRATIGAGTIVMHGAIVNAGARIGQNCIINSQALVEHDAAVADHCHIATHVSINSGVQVGPGTFIGSGSRIRQGLVIGAQCVIGMGSVVRKDCAPGTLFLMQQSKA